jgi:SWIM zinc finger
MSNPTTTSSTSSYDIVDLQGLSAAERAQVRAKEDGRHARTNGHLGQYAVLPQVTRFAKHTSQNYGYTVTVLGPSLAQPVRCACNCKAGTFRPELDVPCRHAGAVVERLVREGLAQWFGDAGEGCARYTPKAVREARDRLNAELEAFESSDTFKAVFE